MQYEIMIMFNEFEWTEKEAVTAYFMSEFFLKNRGKTARNFS
jgi:hypothetical protein